MTQTPNYFLNKFESTDALETTSRMGLNDNTDIIDAELKEHADNFDEISGLIEALESRDYTISTGRYNATVSSGSINWYWEKRNSGKAVCYGDYTISGLDIISAAGSLYYEEIPSNAIVFPQIDGASIFTSAPYVYYSLVKSTNMTWLTGREGTSSANLVTKDHLCSLRVLSPTTRESQTLHISFLAIGQWK